MFSVLKHAFLGFVRTSSQPDVLQNSLKVLSAGLRTYDVPPDFSDVVLPEKPKLKFMEKVPNLKQAKKEMKNLRDIQGPAKSMNTFSEGQFGIVALGGGYLHWGHMEMMRLTINRRMDPSRTFAVWRIKAPYKPITRKGLGQRMGGGKGAIDHYVTPVKCGRLVVEVGGRVELGEVEAVLKEVAKKLPFPAKVVSRESLAALYEEQAERAASNQNPWTFQRIARSNMLGIRKVLSPFDVHNHGRYTGKFFDPKRIFIMKPARGSGRASTRGPRGATNRNTDKTSKPSAEGPHPEPSKMRNAIAGKSKNKANWKPLTKSSLLALENMLGLSVLSVLALKSKEKEESQKHLNLLKNQFLAKCAQLSVPPRKHGDLMHVSHQFKAESKKSENGKKTLEALEENVRSVVSTLEEMEVQMDGLEEKCRIMRSKLEDEEEQTQEFLQLSEQTVLRLSSLPSRPANELTLQEHLMKIIPDPPAVVRALQTAPVLEDVRAFLELAHKQVDAVQAAHRDTALD
ncbi:hypothetical protein QQF64_001705 [Cirrhinus molitorella]|uniref:Large ribosomal subunit protein uL16m n=1 Tax=Cirrhinus molitorella TaxID=172907 RepID=A0ABR3P0U9_9TELE